MKALITGGAGFIGRWVVKYLLKKGNEVWALDNLSNGERNNILEFEENPRFKFIKGDILQRDLLKELFNLNFEVCFHLAAAYGERGHREWSSSMGILSITCL